MEDGLQEVYLRPDISDEDEAGMDLLPVDELPQNVIDQIILRQWYFESVSKVIYQ